MDASSKIERTSLGELRPGCLADFYALLCQKDSRTTREGKPFFTLRFRDRVRSVNATPIWDNSTFFGACQDWNVGGFFKIRGILQEHRSYGPQIEIHNIRPVNDDDHADGFDPSHFSLQTRFDVDELFAELLQHADSITDDGLRSVIRHVLKQNEAQIRIHPAASRNHHAFRGGYLEHTVSVVRLGVHLAEKYQEYYPDLNPPLNRDLIVAGCIVHDIGKLRELEARLDAGEYTVAGMLVGHIVIGRDMIRDAAREVGDVDPELLLYLEHIILAHQGTPEWGSPKPPMIPEAMLVHYADDIDAKMNMFVLALDAHEGEDPFTPRNASLGRRLLGRRSI